MPKRFVGIIAMVGLVVGLFAFAPAIADGHKSCGGKYQAAVEVDTIYVSPGHGVGYCSDGTFQDAGVAPTHSSESSCGGKYAATVETEQIQDPVQPSHKYSYCSDGTIEGVQELLP